MIAVGARVVITRPAYAGRAVEGLVGEVQSAHPANTLFAGVAGYVVYVENLALAGAGLDATLYLAATDLVLADG